MSEENLPLEQRVDIAREKNKTGYNCAQAVLCAFCDLVNLDEETAYRLAEGFGSGVSGLGDTCGAVNAAYMVLSLKNATQGQGAPSSKKENYERIKAFSEAFAKEAGSTVCRELKGEKGKPKLYSCPDCIKLAATLLAKEFEKQ